MDILDLSLSEKRSRRKAHAPQRRQALDGDTTATQTDSSEREDDADQQSICLTKDPASSQQVGTKDKDLAAEPEFSTNPQFQQHKAIDDCNNNSTMSPFSNRSNEGSSSHCIDDISRSPSPTVLMSSNGSNEENSSSRFFSNVNFSSNSNTNNNVLLNRISQHSRNICDAIYPPNAMADLTAFQERLGVLSAALPQRLLGGTAVPRSDTTAFDVQPIDTPGIPERTKKQNRWAFNVWREWARKRNLTCGATSENFGKVPLDVGKATEVELDFWLAKFVQEIRRKDGNPYPPHTLMQIVMGIQRYLRQQAGRPSICILDRSNPTYGRFRSVLDSRIKELTNDGVTSSHKSGRRSSLPVSGPTLPSSNANYPEQDVLWSAGIIGSDSALGLLNAVFYHNTVTFGIRNVDDHWNLKMAHFILGNRGQQTQSYIEFVPSRDPVYVNRGMTKDCRVYADSANPRCVVKLFQKYMSLVPPNGAFYRHPQEPTLVDRSIRFSDQWVGKNRLRAMIRHVFDSTRLDGRDRNLSVVPVSVPVSHELSSDKQNSTNHRLEPNPVTPNVYDRLAQVMIQLSHMRSPQVSGMNSSASSIHNPTPPPKSETPGSDHLLQVKQEHFQTSPEGSNESQQVMKRSNSPDEPPAKRVRSNDNNQDDVTVTSSSGEKDIDENTMEIVVPRTITAVTIVKGTRRFTVQLD